jgi:hypothetical protein
MPKPTPNPLLLLSLILLAPIAKAQQAQQLSPMVEYTRAHPRLTKTTSPGRQIKLDLGTLFIPEKLAHKKTLNLLLFFHGGDWLPQLAASQQHNLAVITVQAGAGSGTYIKLFEDPTRFLALLSAAEQASNIRFNEVWLGGWSAGCGALRQILADPASYDRVHRVLCIDGVHAGYVNNTPNPLDPQLVPENLVAWLHFGQDALGGKKRLLITHTEIFPGTYASTTETADYLLNAWGLTEHPVARFGPMQTQMLSETKSSGLTVLGFAGNSAPDHIDQLHSLSTYLHWLSKP